MVLYLEDFGLGEKFFLVSITVIYINVVGVHIWNRIK